MCTAVIWWVLTQSVGDVMSVWRAARDWRRGVDCAGGQQVCIYRMFEKKKFADFRDVRCSFLLSKCSPSTCANTNPCWHVISVWLPDMSTQLPALLHFIIAHSFKNSWLYSSPPTDILSSLLLTPLCHGSALNTPKYSDDPHSNPKNFSSSVCVGKLPGPPLHVFFTVHRRVWSKYSRYSGE